MPTTRKSRGIIFAEQQIVTYSTFEVLHYVNHGDYFQNGDF